MCGWRAAPPLYRCAVAPLHFCGVRRGICTVVGTPSPLLTGMCPLALSCEWWEIRRSPRRTARVASFAPPTSTNWSHFAHPWLWRPGATPHHMATGTKRTCHTHSFGWRPGFKVLGLTPQHQRHLCVLGESPNCCKHSPFVRQVVCRARFESERAACLYFPLSLFS